MKRFKNILVLLGGVSEQDPALLRATALAASNQARLTLALCLEEFGDQPPGDELRRAVVDGLRARLLALADGLRQRGFRADADILFGRTFIQAIVRVLSRQHDLAGEDRPQHTRCRARRCSAAPTCTCCASVRARCG